MLKALLYIAIAISFGMISQAFAIELGLPLQCEVGVNCWIQQYADHDPTSGTADYTCSSETYNGHDGTDFRVPNITSDVTVVAAAEGQVEAMRDGVSDRLATTPELLATVSRVECGNGVVIKHEDGFETQYCHMKMGSLVVKTGDKVAAGTVLGKVGYSGAAAFPHLHLSVRHKGEKLDPFSGPIAQDCHALPNSLWSSTAAKALAYQPTHLLDLGWADRPVSPEALEQGQIANLTPALSWPALVGYVRLINLKMGDTVVMAVSGPSGEVAINKQTLDHDKAQLVLFAGKKINGTWLAGNYAEQVAVTREGKIILSQKRQADLK